MTPVFLDGQTRRFFIAEFPRVHGELSGEFRPTTLEETEHINASVRAIPFSDHAKNAAYTIGVIAKYLKSWSAAEPLVAENVRRLHPLLANRLLSIIVGRDGGDAPPAESTAPGEFDEFTRELLAAGGASPGPAREGATVKNS